MSSEVMLYALKSLSSRISINIITDKAYWIFDDVLESVFDHGAYLTDAKIEEILTDPDTVIRLATDLKSEREQRRALELATTQQTQLIAQLAPKATYYDLIMQTKDVVSATQIAKDYGKSAQWLNEKLHELGVQFRQGGQWVLYQKHTKKGYTGSKTHSYVRSDGSQHSQMHTYWTQMGRKFIYEALKSDGIVPQMERNALGKPDQLAQS